MRSPLYSPSGNGFRDQEESSGFPAPVDNFLTSDPPIKKPSSHALFPDLFPRFFHPRRVISFLPPIRQFDVSPCPRPFAPDFETPPPSPPGGSLPPIGPIVRRCGSFSMSLHLLYSPVFILSFSPFDVLLIFPSFIQGPLSPPLPPPLTLLFASLQVFDF